MGNVDHGVTPQHEGSRLPRSLCDSIRLSENQDWPRSQFDVRVDVLVNEAAADAALLEAKCITAVGRQTKRE